MIVGVSVLVGVRVMVRVSVMVGVCVMVGVLVGVRVLVGVAVQLLIESVIVQSPQPGKLKVRLTDHAPVKVELLKSAIHETWVPLPSIGRSGTSALVFRGEATMVVELGS